MHDRGNLSQLRSELRTLLALAIPVILSELGWVAMGIVDTIMVGRLGPEAIGAVGISSAAYYAPALFGIGILLGLDTVVSQAWGRRDFEVCHRWLAQGVYCVICYTPFAMLGIAGLPLLFHRFGINPAVSGDAAVYLRILNLGTLPLLIYAHSADIYKAWAACAPSPSHSFLRTSSTGEGTGRSSMVTWGCLRWD